MAGLLGNGWEDPQSAAIMALAGGLLQGNFGAGLLGANQAYGDHKANALKQQLLQAQIGETQAQAQERAMKIKQAEAAQAEEQRIRSLIGGAGRPAPGMGATNLVNGALPADLQIGAQPQIGGGGIDYRSLYQQGVPFERIKQLADTGNLGREEVARTINVPGPNGEKMVQQMDKFGRPVGQPMSEFEAAQFLNLGDRQVAAIPRAGMSFKTGQSPDSAASSALGWANHGLSKQRLSFDQGQAAQPKPQFHDGQWVTPPTAQNPGGMTVPVNGFKKQLGEGAKKQVTGIDALGGAIDEYVKELDGFGVMDLARPDKRAGMGTKYNNMMLQAKEAYNLGVLNGPDYAILTSVVTDPISMKGAITSNAAMAKQASELKRIMGQVRQSVTNQGAGSGNAGGATGGWGIQKVN